MFLTVIIFLVLFVSYFGVGIFCHWANRRQIFDIPSERSSHDEPMPRGGGLVIVLITLLGGCFFYIFTEPNLSERAFWSYIGGGFLVASVSWIDDLFGLSYRIRFLVQGVAALLAVWGIGIPPVIFVSHLEWMGGIFAFLWIIGLTNAYNFMDGIDGMAGGQAVVAGVGWWILGTWCGYSFVGALGFLLAFSCLGFLGHNWSPARIFMGDVGSAFLGYSFALLSLFGAQLDPNLFWFGCFLVWPFIFDTVFTFVRRFCNKENVFQAHRSHLYQRLVIRNVTHPKVVVLYIFLALLCGIMGLLILNQWLWPKWIGIFFIVLFSIGLWLFVVWLEKKPLSVLNPDDSL